MKEMKDDLKLKKFKKKEPLEELDELQKVIPQAKRVKVEQVDNQWSKVFSKMSSQI